ncbi:MAG TPA: hypothetical protein VM287_00910, partial [Egibacteraceae bacterium]|nr:hypothetical protein [Egibacteraceae bacterium]
DIQSSTFVFDMNVVFEDFLTAALREALRRYGGVLRSQDHTHSLDEDGALSLKPDLAWWDRGRCLAVIDAKYKAIDAGVMRAPDAYQMLAYVIAYGLPRGHLVYARDSGATTRRHVISNVDREILVTAIDVEQQPEEVLTQVEALAAQ